jgi:uncharacterized protein (TIGR02246 family)
MQPAPYFSDPDEAESAFYAAFEAADTDTMMSLWADDDTITCIHPGGSRLVGRAEILESWRQIFANPMRLRFRVSRRHALSDEGVAVHSVQEEIEIEGRAGVAAVVAATNVFVLTDSGWRLWMHHASNTLPPEAEAESTPQDDPGTRPTLH